MVGCTNQPPASSRSAATAPPATVVTPSACAIAWYSCTLRYCASVVIGPSIWPGRTLFTASPRACTNVVDPSLEEQPRPGAAHLTRVRDEGPQRPRHRALEVRV